MKKIEKMLLEAYKMGQDSVSYMKVINNGIHKPSHAAWCDDEPCKHKIDQETTTTEDEMLKKILAK
jgi:hypothetical protein